jgi:probable HAF family extracellular repeat protein
LALVLGVAITLLVTAGLVGAKGKPPKPPPEPPGPAYTLIDLGHLGGGTSTAIGINESGQVAGNSMNADGKVHAFLVTPEDTDGDGKPDRWFHDDDDDGFNDLMTDLGLLGGGTLPNTNMEWFTAQAADINDHGQVVGWSSIDEPTQTERYHACLWNNGEIIDLGVFVAGGESVACAINNHGQIVGYQVSGNVAAGSFLILPEPNEQGELEWYRDDDDDGVNDLMTTLGSEFRVEDINDAGQVLGRKLLSQRALLLTPEEDTNGTLVWWRDEDGDGLSDLIVPLLPLEDGSGPTATGLNASGQVVGSSASGGKWNMTHAVRWSSDYDLPPTDLGAPGKLDTSLGVALNDQGDVVGRAGRNWPTWDLEAMLWTGGKMYYLLEILTNGEGIDSIEKAYDINNAGQIVGYTWRGEVNEAFVAIPTGN